MAGNDYTPEHRSRNQRTVLLTTAGVLGCVTISGTLQSWPLSAFLVVFVFVGLGATVFWKLFASPSARRLPTDSLPHAAKSDDVEIGKKLRRIVRDSASKQKPGDGLS